MPRLVSDDMPTTCRRAVGLFYILLTATAITCTRRRKSGRRKPEAIASATEGSADRSNPADWAFYFCALQTHRRRCGSIAYRSEENTSELQSLMRRSYAVFCLKKKKH